MKTKRKSKKLKLWVVEVKNGLGKFEIVAICRTEKMAESIWLPLERLNFIVNIDLYEVLP